MFCPNCHAAATNGDKFCQQCGYLFAQATSPAQPESPPAHTESAASQTASFGFCRTCGKPLNNPNICLSCGVPVGTPGTFCGVCGKPTLPNAVICTHCGCMVDPPVATNGVFADGDDAYRKLSDYEKTSGVIWLVIGIVQICTLIGVLCGIWNIFAATTRLKAGKELTNHPAGVVERYENSLAEILIIMVLNLFFGAVIGIVGSLFDLYVRNYVMSHRTRFLS